jgi:hypothetical protein
MRDEFRIFLARSKLRLLVLNKLGEKPQIASFLAHDLNKHREIISRIFLDLVKLKLAECINQEAPSFRYYKISRQGRKLLNELKLKI